MKGGLTSDDMSPSDLSSAGLTPFMFPVSPRVYASAVLNTSFDESVQPFKE